jgi:hypothetical protein
MTLHTAILVNAMLDLGVVLAVAAAIFGPFKLVRRHGPNRPRRPAAALRIRQLASSDARRGPGRARVCSDLKRRGPSRTCAGYAGWRNG